MTAPKRAIVVKTGGITMYVEDIGQTLLEAAIGAFRHGDGPALIGEVTSIKRKSEPMQYAMSATILRAAGYNIVDTEEPQP